MEIVRMTSALVEEFLSRPIRPEDVQEWLDTGGVHPKDAAMANFMGLAVYRKAVLDDDGVPVVLFGVSRNGTLSLIGADRPELAVPIHQQFSREEWPLIMSLFDRLQAYPSVKNTRHHKWLEWVGFTAKGVGPLLEGHGDCIEYVWERVI